MASRPQRYDANLPHNLTYRRARKSFYWRNPITGEEISFGQIARRDAIAQAIEANNYIESNFQPVALLERLRAPVPPPIDPAVNSVATWLKQYTQLLNHRGLAENTMKMRILQIGYINQKFGKMQIDAITTKHIADFINAYVDEGKSSMAVNLRSFLSDVNTTLAEVIEQCLNNSKSEYLISSASKKSGREPGALNADSLTKAFVKALKATDLVYEISPPSFHEIRSLASRLYEAEYSKEFAQKLLGHKSMKMTNVYLDSRKNEWVEI
ncbi:tyrosine-type recombinase/integrase [Yersinia frederiksenii]|uniref:tyrosine-type recombinase/integrase n=1 Tax=Yersinia frederiksenii TaxID=29484 RepID=UPI0005E59E5E|nr:tyrosine-type recombinase/integrase [Yersinia frederiksenii]CNF37927.1 phage integrase [Yersinia frederiksenii]